MKFLGQELFVPLPFFFLFSQVFEEHINPLPKKNENLEVDRNEKNSLSLFEEEL
jgi:hypothetical protein